MRIKMSRLRIYRQNKGNMLELVRYQKQEIPMVAGAEEVIYSATQMLSAESRESCETGRTGRYACVQYPLPTYKKDSSIEKSHMGIVRKEKNGYSKGSYRI